MVAVGRWGGFGSVGSASANADDVDDSASVPADTEGIGGGPACVSTSPQKLSERLRPSRQAVHRKMCVGVGAHGLQRPEGPEGMLDRNRDEWWFVPRHVG